MLKYIYCVVILAFLFWPILSKYINKCCFLKMMTLCFGFFLVSYIYISCFLLYFDAFSVGRTLKLQACIEIMMFIIIHPSIKKSINQVEYNIKDNLGLLVIVLFFGTVIHLKSVPIAPLFDAGVYGAKTIDLLNGDTSTIKELSEFEIMEGESRQELIDLQKTQAGIYPFPYSLESREFKYEYHGLPTWPSVMALSAKCYGLEDMSKILSVCFVLLSFFLYFLLGNLAVKRASRWISLLIFCGSPLMLYLAKLPLSEMLITTLVVFGMFLLTEDSLVLKGLAALVIGAVGLTHLSLFMYMPAIFMALLMLCETKRKKIYGIINIVSNFMMPLTLAYAYKVSSLYVTGQLKKSFGYLSYNISANIIIMMISCMSIAFIIIQIAFLFLPENSVFRQSLRNLYCNHRKKIIVVILLVLFVFTVYQGYIIGFTTKLEITDDSWRFRAGYINKGLFSLKYLNIVNILMATSWIALPMVTLNMVKNNKEEVDILNFLLLYALGIYTIIRCDSPINYSSSRYFVTMIIPCITILLGIYIKTVKQGLIIGLVYLVSSLPFNITLATTEEYYGNIQLLEDISIVVGKGSWVLINPEDVFLNYQLTTNLREYNQNKVFNMASLDEVIKKSGEVPVYALSQHELDGDEYEKILEKPYRIVGELVSLDVIYPTEVGKTSNLVYAYRVSK